MGCGLALVCALGWDIEGAVAGFGTTLIEYNIGITIHQRTSGIANLIILLPVLCLIDGNLGLELSLLGGAITDSSIIFFIISSFFAMPAFSFWYKDTSMRGAPGMVCNGMYAFRGPWCMIVEGILDGHDGWMLTPIQWIMAIVMVGNLNPLDIFKEKEA